MNINLEVTSTFTLHYESPKDKFFIISQGSGRSGKTYSILQCMVLDALAHYGKKRIYSIVAETFPFIKRGALRDFEDILTKAGVWNRKKFNKTDSTYELFGNTFEFFSVENMGKALGAARDVLFINECNNVGYEIAFHLIARTRERTYLDYNPVGEFWVQTEIMDNIEFKNKYHFVKTTFLTNEALDESIKEIMLARAAKDPNYKRVYVDGEMGTIENIIFPHYKLIDSIPEEILNKKQYIGLDFGYTGDETAINEVYIVGDKTMPVQALYINELAYYKGLSNKNIADIIKKYRSNNYLTVADSSEPKSINEISSYGITIDGVTKGPDSIAFGISLMKGADIYVTKNSTNTIKEFRNYTYAKDRYGKPIKDRHGRQVPIEIWNHSIDGIRYVGLYHTLLYHQYKNVPRRKPTGLVPA